MEKNSKINIEERKNLIEDQFQNQRNNAFGWNWKWKLPQSNLPSKMGRSVGHQNSIFEKSDLLSFGSSILPNQSLCDQQQWCFLEFLHHGIQQRAHQYWNARKSTFIDSFCEFVGFNRTIDQQPPRIDFKFGNAFQTPKNCHWIQRGERNYRAFRQNNLRTYRQQFSDVKILEMGISGKCWALQQHQ